MEPLGRERAMLAVEDPSKGLRLGGWIDADIGI
jgi:hypothetical protein